MKRSPPIFAVAALAALTASLPLLAADTLPWPWKDTTPPDPALALLYQVEDVVAVINKSEPPTLDITVNAVAPTPGYTELKLTPRMDDPADQKFEFDARGRPPQDFVTQVLTPVTIEATYADAPLESVKVIEVHGQANCKAYSLAEAKPVPCNPKEALQ